MTKKIFVLLLLWRQLQVGQIRKLRTLVLAVANELTVENLEMVMKDPAMYFRNLMTKGRFAKFLNLTMSFNENCQKKNLNFM